MHANKGDRIRIEYKGFLDDGRVFDSTEQHGFPLKLTIGEGVYLEALEQAIIGMKINEEKTIRLSPKEAYGEYLPDRIEIVEKQNLPENSKLEEGSLIILISTEGTETQAKIIEVTDDEVILDFNHPLAGIPLNFRLKLVEIIR